MNKGTLIGFISSDIKSETLNLKNGETMKKIGFNIACQRKGKNAGADFPRVIAFGRTAEIVEQYMCKGKGCIIEFHVQTSSYTNKEGKRIYQTDLICDSIEFPPIRKDEESTPVNNQQAYNQQPDDTHTEETPPSAPDEQFINIPESDFPDLPFR